MRYLEDGCAEEGSVGEDVVWRWGEEGAEEGHFRGLVRGGFF